jgi:hypothetical protein
VADREAVESGEEGKMAKSYRLIHGEAHEVERQLTVLSTQNREGNSAEQKPVFMSSTTVANPQGGGHVWLSIIIEADAEGWDEPR